MLRADGTPPPRRAYVAAAAATPLSPRYAALRFCRFFGTIISAADAMPSLRHYDARYACCHAYAAAMLLLMLTT